jgi:predicted small metal-binding protein
MKTLRCRDVGQNCSAEFKAADEQQIMQKMSEHARSVHQLELKNDPSMMSRVRGAIRDE